MGPRVGAAPHTPPPPALALGLGHLTPPGDQSCHTLAMPQHASPSHAFACHPGFVTHVVRHAFAHAGRRLTHRTLSEESFLLPPRSEVSRQQGVDHVFVGSAAAAQQPLSRRPRQRGGGSHSLPRARRSRAAQPVHGHTTQHSSEHNRRSRRCQSLQAEEQPGRQRALSLLPQGQQALLRTFPLVSP